MHPINWKNHTCVSMETSACRLCHVFVDPAKMLCRTLFNHLNLCLFFSTRGKEVLNIFCTSLWEYKYIYMNWIYIDRYNIIAEGLLFIMTFEKLPCFNKKKKRKKKNKSKCIVHLLQQLQRGQPAEIQSLRHCSLPPHHFYKCTKTRITTFCLLDDEQIYMNLKIL